jgi:predicted outer membrane protein
MREAGEGPIDRTYVDAQLSLHEKYLAALDEQLIPNARDSRLKQALRDTRQRVTSHLDEVRKLKRALADEADPKSSIPVGPAPL